MAPCDDPTVMAWEVANEPRPAGGPAASPPDGASFKAWLRSAAAVLKAAAPRQLVASGMEGDTGDVSLAQAMLISQDVPEIDVLTAHVWPQNFEWLLSPGDASSDAYALAAARAYLTAHAAYAAALGKPLLVEECAS